MTDAFLLSPFGARLRSPKGAFLRKIRKQLPPIGDIYVGGSFSNFDGVSTNNLVRYDIIDSDWNSNSVGSEVSSLIGFNKQLIAGLFAGTGTGVVAVTGATPGSSLPSGNVYGLVLLGGNLVAYGEISGTPILKQWTGSGAWTDITVPSDIQTIISAVVIDGVFYCRGRYDDGTEQGYIAKYDGVDWTVQANTFIQHSGQRYKVTAFNGSPVYANGTAYNTDYGQLFSWAGTSSGGIAKYTGEGGEGFFGSSGGLQQVISCFTHNSELYASGLFQYWDFGNDNQEEVRGICKLSAGNFVSVDAMPSGLTARQMTAINTLNDGRVLVGFNNGSVIEVGGVTGGSFFEYTANTWSLFESSTGINTGSRINSIFDFGTLGILITGVDPNTGSTLGGDIIIISGFNFTPTTQIEFDDVPLDTTFINSKTLEIVTVAHVAGAVDVKAIDGEDTHILPASFTFVEDDPEPEDITVTNISPDNGTTAGGTSVTITGTGFTPDCNVRFAAGRDGEFATSVTIVSDTEITCNTPAWSYGAGFVDIFVTDTVTTEFGILANGFEYT
jgi:hypothetical protein